jgi:hypothetical protein
MLKRTMLDMDGVLSTASLWVEQASATGSDPLISQAAAQKLLQDEPVSITSRLPSALNVDEMAESTELKPEEIELIMTGKPVVSMSSKSLADSVLFDLSDEDRDILEKMNAQHAK